MLLPFRSAVPKPMHTYGNEYGNGANATFIYQLARWAMISVTSILKNYEGTSLKISAGSYTRKPIPR